MIWPFRRRNAEEKRLRETEETTQVTLTVPDDAPGLQEAIDAAPDGARILVRPGRYRESIDFSGKQLTLSSEDPRDADTVARTIIEGDGNGTVVNIVRGEGPEARLMGFTITGGSARIGEAAEGGGVTVRGGARPVIENNVIHNNCSELDGGGIYIDDSAPTVTRNQIRNNAAAGCGGGVHVGRDSVRSTGYEVEPAFGERMGRFLDRSMPRTFQITASEDDSEHAFRDEASGGFVQEREEEERPRPRVEGNTIVGNAAMWGGGLFVSDEAPVIEGNAFRDNCAHRGGGISVWDNSRAVVHRNILVGNVAHEEGGAVIVEWGASPVLIANRMTDNHSRLGILSVATNSAPIMQRNVLSDNECSDGKHLYLWESHRAVMEDNQVAGDEE